MVQAYLIFKLGFDVMMHSCFNVLVTSLRPHSLEGESTNFDWLQGFSQYLGPLHLT